jgi:DNA-binding response OmpR family regulator
VREQSRKFLGLVAQAAGKTNLSSLDDASDGWAGAELAAPSPTAGIGVPYISGHTGDELARRLLLDASEPFLQKPFPPDELVERVQELLELRAQRPDD